MGNNIGLIKWFDKEKGFGVVKSLPEIETFIHKNEFAIAPEKILVATSFIFESKHGRQGRLEAINAHPLSSFEDLKLIMDLLGKPDTVEIEVDVTVKKRYGSTFRKREIKSYGIKMYAIHF